MRNTRPRWQPGWFWRGWYFNNWTFDVAVEGAEPIDGDWAKGTEVRIANRDPLVLPVTDRDNNVWKAVPGP